MTDSESAFIKLMSNPLKLKYFLFRKLPSAYFSGVRVKHLDTNFAEVTVPYKWFSKNPFRSTYFACLSMAAEMSTGLLAMMCIYKKEPAVSMLVLSVTGNYHKKAMWITTFRCDDGDKIRKAVEEAVQTGESRTIQAISKGTNEKGELVADFSITWSFKARK
jgi:acyl-coenzyme A thioesterase PaaI-like protein